MKKTILKIITMVTACIFSIGLISPAVFADGVTDICNSPDAASAVKKAAGCEGNGNELPSIIENILEAIIIILGTVAVIFVIIGGVNYMTSSGDTGKLEKAKKTILYACIGLVICVLSFIIVNWTISAIKGAEEKTQAQQTQQQSKTEEGKDSQ